MHIYLSAGLLLYCLDIVLRLIQLSTPVEVRWSATTSDKGIAVLGIENTKSLCPLSTLFINAPQLSKFQWHPVTPVCNGGSEIKVTHPSCAHFCDCRFPIALTILQGLGLSDENWSILNPTIVHSGNDT